MGESIQVQWLGDKAYIVYRSQKTDWKCEVKEMTEKQIAEHKNLCDEFSENEEQLLRQMW